MEAPTRTIDELAHEAQRQAELLAQAALEEEQKIKAEDDLFFVMGQPDVVFSHYTTEQWTAFDARVQANLKAQQDEAKAKRLAREESLAADRHTRCLANLAMDLPRILEVLGQHGYDRLALDANGIKLSASLPTPEVKPKSTSTGSQPDMSEKIDMIKIILTNGSDSDRDALPNIRKMENNKSDTEKRKIIKRLQKENQITSVPYKDGHTEVYDQTKHAKLV